MHLRAINRRVMINAKDTSIQMQHGEEELPCPGESSLSKGRQHGVGMILTLPPSSAWPQPRRKAELLLTTLTSLSFLEKQEPPAGSEMSAALWAASAPLTLADSKPNRLKY